MKILVTAVLLVLIYCDKCDSEFNGWSSQSLSCAPGFGGNPCECRAEHYRGLLKCENERAYIIHGYWAGECENGTLCTGTCSFGFCSYNGSIDYYRLPGTVSELDEYICGDTRTGVLCGECRDNHSVSYHSFYFTCTPDEYCRYGWLLYIVSEMLPLILFFIIVVVFNLSFTSGAINSFILFAQLLDSLAIQGDGVIHVSSLRRYLIDISAFFYRFFNFDFFSIEELSFCLWRGATTLDVMAFKYVTVVSGLVLMLICVYIVNSSKAKRLFPCLRPSTLRSSLIHGLSAFFVMCYSQCARISLHILTPTDLTKEGHQYVKTVVYRNGELSMFEPVHLKYAIPAIFFSLTLLLLPPIVLTVYPLLGKILNYFNRNESRIAHFISRLLPIQLLDSFQGTFRDNMRLFSGFYFLYRLSTLAAYCFSRSISEFYCTLEVLFIAILALHAIVQPHKRRIHNVIDILLFSNLAAINAISLLNYFKATLGRPNSRFVTLSFFFQVGLIYLPLVSLFVVCLAKAWKLITSKHKRQPETQRLLSCNNLPPLREEYIPQDD